jgi:hypothetical protein
MLIEIFAMTHLETLEIHAHKFIRNCICCCLVFGLSPYVPSIKLERWIIV